MPPPREDAGRFRISSTKPVLFGGALSATLTHRRAEGASGAIPDSGEIRWELSSQGQPSRELIERVGRTASFTIQTLGNYRWTVDEYSSTPDSSIVVVSLLRSPLPLDALSLPPLAPGTERTLWLSTEGVMTIRFGRGSETDLGWREAEDLFVLKLELVRRVGQSAGLLAAKVWAARPYDRNRHTQALWLPDGTPIEVADHTVEVMDVQLGRETTAEGNGGLRVDVFPTLHVQLRVARKEKKANEDLAHKPAFVGVVEIGRPLIVAGQRRVSSLYNNDWANIDPDTPASFEKRK